MATSVVKDGFYLKMLLQGNFYQLEYSEKHRITVLADLICVAEKEIIMSNS